MTEASANRDNSRFVRLRNGRFLQSALGVTFAGVVLLGLLAGLRWVTLGSPVLFAIVPLAPVGLLLGFLLLAALSLFALRRRLALGALACVLLIAALQWPPTLTPGSACHSEWSESSVVVYSHNVSYEQGVPVVVAEQLEELQPGVVLLQEADTEFIAALQANLADPYPHSVQSGSEQTLSLAVLSRTPLSDVIDTTGGDPMVNPFLVVSVDLPVGSMRLANVHLSAPRNGELIARRRAEFSYLASSEFLGLDVDYAMGDFNSTNAHSDFRKTVDAMDGSTVASCGLGGTWSPLKSGPGVLTLDHAIRLDSDQNRPVLRMHRYAGSDHRGVSLTLG